MTAVVPTDSPSHRIAPMALSVTCSGCHAPLRIRETYAGRQMTCPRCGAGFIVPVSETLATEESGSPLKPVEGPPPGPTKLCPVCRQAIPVAARRCRHCRRWVPEEDEDAPAGDYKPCPRCGTSGASRVLFTFWGSFYGPALFCHVRCPECGATYNGRTGRSNLIPAIVCVLVPLLLILLILGGVGTLLYSLD